MKQLKSVKMLSDVTCQNCTSYNQGQCYHELPAISVAPDNKCVKGSWLFNGNVINFFDISRELLPVNFVNDVEDLVCKNCVSYDSSREQCHFHRRDIYKTGPNDLCNNGTWFEDDSTGGSLRVLYPKLIAIKDTEGNSLKSKRIKTFSDVICENCISYNQGRCCKTLPFIPVGPDNKCHEGEWLHKRKILNFHGICHYLVPDNTVKDIENLKCGECVFYYPLKGECHFYRQNVYKSGPEDWCNNGEWLYEDTDNWVISGSLGFLYPKLTESKVE